MNKYPKFLTKYGKVDRLQTFDISDFKELYWMHVPSGIMEFLETNQISSLMNGFLWTLNPMEHIDWLKELLKDTSDLDLIKIPFARTVFGDIFYIESESINLFSSSRMTLEIFALDAKSLFEWTLSDSDYIDEKLNYSLFERVQGKPNMDNCFPLEFDKKELKIKPEVKFEEYKEILFRSKEQIKWEEV